MMIIKCIDKIYFKKRVGNWSKYPEFDNMSYDSRNVIDKTLFVAYKGSKNDGNSYVDEAIKKGASFIICETDKFFDKKNIDIPILITDNVLKTLFSLVKNIRLQKKEQKIIAITGSNGKTTTKDALYSVLKSVFNVGKTTGNYNNEWGVPYTYLNNLDKDILVLEMGMDRLGDIKVLTELVIPDIGIITNIEPVHLEFMKSVENIYRGKTDLFRYMKEGGLKLVNGDNIHLKNAPKEFPNVYTYGFDDENDYSAKILKRIDIKTSFIFDEKEYSINLWGTFNVYNVLPAIIIASKIGMVYGQIKKGLENIVLSEKRMKLFSKEGKLVIDDTYNSSPNAVMKVLENFDFFYKEKKKLVAMGDMLELGDDTEFYHARVLDMLEKMENCYVFLFGNNFYLFKDRYKNFKFFIDESEMKDEIKNVFDECEVFLFKGSRGMRMERFIEYLKELF